MLESEVWDLIHSFEYIEKVRAYGVNLGNKTRRLPRTHNADLYFSGKNLYLLIEKHGTIEQKEHLARIVAQHKGDFQ